MKIGIGFSMIQMRGVAIVLRLVQIATFAFISRWMEVPHLWHGGMSVTAPVDNSVTDEPKATSFVSEDKDLSGSVGKSIDLLETELQMIRTQLEDEKRKNTDLRNRMKYLQADIINLQKQSDRAASEARNQVRLTMIFELISVKEDLERALHASESSDKHTLVDGLGLVLSRIDSTLKSETVEGINPKLGDTFDPRIHEAVAYVDGKSQKEGSILSVVRNGYTVGGKVIKPALVEVARQIHSEDAGVNQKPGANTDSGVETGASANSSES